VLLLRHDVCLLGSVCGGVDAAQARVPVLLGVGDGADLGFEGLVVLAFDLEFGLEFFDEEVEAGDFEAKFLDVGGSGGACGGIVPENRGRILRGIGVGLCEGRGWVRLGERGWIGGGRNCALAEWGGRAGSESVGECVGPGRRADRQDAGATGRGLSVGC
jgi:hypothetical protein